MTFGHRPRGPLLTVKPMIATDFAPRREYGGRPPFALKESLLKRAWVAGKGVGWTACFATTLLPLREDLKESTSPLIWIPCEE
jgi:hypothetical protein